MSVLALGLYKAAKTLIPPSIQVFFAGVAGCNIDQQALSENDSQFEGTKWWEYPLMHIFNIDQRYFARQFVVSDSVIQNASVYHILLAASDETGAACDKEILSLLDRYSEIGAPIDHYGDNGLTALQEAIITQNISIVKALLENGADKTLRTRIDRPSINGLDAIELAEYFSYKNPNDPEISAMLSELKK
jgi:ankyrin repeat protein